MQINGERGRGAMSEITAKPSSIDELEVGMELQGTVKRIELFGAFVDIGIGHDGLLHISQLGRPNVRNVEDVVKAGEQITVYILKVEQDTGRIALSLVKPPAMPWDDIKEGSTVTGTVVRMENFGVFVDIGAERPGMIHVSELASGYVNSPSDVVKVGDPVTAQVIKVNRKKRRIDLSLKALEQAEVAVAKAAVAADEAEEEYQPTAMELALRRAMEANGETYVAPSKSTSRKRDRRADKRERQRDQMEDIFERTLRGNHRG
ncbi:MAG: S1 RNA-binding domain-containing protein [Chloroflexi bacterium]|nr:S1 RNA-binding domain-containing protein [Chloroflexota bacterium]